MKHIFPKLVGHVFHHTFMSVLDLLAELLIVVLVISRLDFAMDFTHKSVNVVELRIDRSLHIGRS